MKKTSLIVLLVVLLVLAFVGYEWRYSLFGGQSGGQNQLVAQASYQCAQGKTINAAFYQGPEVAVQPGQMPEPNGSVNLTLSDGRTMTLAQTISADGVRYSDGDPQKQQGQAGAESFVFWSKGNGALVLENNQEKSYIGCVKVAADPGSLSKVYSDKAGSFSVRYPAAYTVDSTYVYQLGSKPIAGVKFTIDPAIATGTNLGSDSYVSVEQIAIASTSSAQAPGCSAKNFLDMPNGGQVSQVTEGDTTYSYASSTDAAAGNRYEEQVFALPGSNPCTAVRYLIHWGVYENYPTGSVKEFDHGSLVNQFDAIRRTLIVNQ